MGLPKMRQMRDGGGTHFVYNVAEYHWGSCGLSWGLARCRTDAPDPPVLRRFTISSLHIIISQEPSTYALRFATRDERN